MNILQVSSSDEGGGAEIVARRLFDSFRNHGHNSWLAVGKKQNDDPNVFIIPNDEFRNKWTKLCHKIGKSVSNSMGSRIPISICNSLGQPRRQLNRWQGKEDFDFPGTSKLLNLTPEKVDLLHCHNLHGRYFDLRALPRLSHEIPTILTLHDAWPLTGHCAHSFDCEKWKNGCGQCPNLNIYPKVKRDATAYNWQRKRDIFCKSRLHVATPCNWLMNNVEQSILASAIIEKRVIHNGVDFSLFHPSDKQIVRNSLGLPEDAFILLFAGHRTYSNPWKDYATMEAALKKVAHKNKEANLLFICLGEEMHEDEIRIGSARIRFIAYKKDPAIVAQFYQAADIYLHAANVDTFPNTILEALACGTPVIATSVGGIPEMINNKQTGFLVPPKDSDAIAAQIEIMLEDESLMYNLSKNAVEDVHKRFDLNKQVEKYLEWYKEII